MDAHFVSIYLYLNNIFEIESRLIRYLTFIVSLRKETSCNSRLSFPLNAIWKFYKSNP